MNKREREWMKYLLKNYINMSYIVFEQIKGYIDWEFLSKQNLPTKFLMKYLFELDIKQICKNSYLSDEFLIKYKDWLDWVIILERKDIILSNNVKQKCKNNIMLILNA